MDIWRRISHDLLVQGSGSTPWTWHIWCRYTTDDLALTAVKQYLDFHKIAGYMNFLNDNFMPAELGWWGILDDAPDHRATTPDEVELLGVRSAALDVPYSIETDVESLRANGRTEEMLQLLSQYERLRLSGKLTADVRNKLRNGEWHLVDESGKNVFYSVVYSSQYGSPTAKITLTNDYAEFWGSGPIRIFDKNGNQQQSILQPARIPTVRNDENTITVKSPASADVKLTTILLGDPVSP